MDTQEPRNKKIGLAVTESEYRDAQLVAAYRGTDLSNLLRDATVAEVAEDAARIRSVPLTKAS